MKTIHKFHVANRHGSPCINVNAGGQFLNIGQQDGEICFWFEVDDSKPIWPIPICIVGTGQDIDAEIGPCLDKRYLGSVQMPSGSIELVLHVYQPIR
jgi:hypothetical protein